MIQAEQLHARILEELDLSRDIPDEELTELIHRVLDEASGREYILSPVNHNLRDLIIFQKFLKKIKFPECIK